MIVVAWTVDGDLFAEGLQYCILIKETRDSIDSNE